MNTILELDAEFMSVVRPLDNRPLDRFLKELIVLELYRRRQISSGKAASLLKMSQSEFIRYASEQGISVIDMSDAEFEDEIKQLTDWS